MSSSGIANVGSESPAAGSISFLIDWDPDFRIIVTENNGTLEFTIAVVAGSGDKNIADIQGLFFDVKDNVVTGLKVTGTDVTGHLFAVDAVTQVEPYDSGARNGIINISGSPANVESLESFESNKTYDVGVKIGTPGKSLDDIQKTTFTLSSDTGPLSLDLVADQWFGVRLTSVGPEGDRESSLKLAGKAPTYTPLDDATGGDDDTGGDDTGEDIGENDKFDDLVEAGDGDDTILGGLGNDEMQGEGGDDIIVGGKDRGSLKWQGDTLKKVTIGDNLYGNDGHDTYVYGKGDGVDLIWDFMPGEDVIEIRGYASTDIVGATFVREVANRIATGSHDKITLVLGKSNDAIVINDFAGLRDNQAVAIRFADGKTLSMAQLLKLVEAMPVAVEGDGDTSVETAAASAQGVSSPSLDLFGSNDADTLVGRAGNDRLYGNEGVNWLNGKAGEDQLFGGNVSDILLGEEGDDLVYGNGGADTMIGGAGSDKLYGGGGADLIYGDKADDIELPAALLESAEPSEGATIEAGKIEITENWWGGFEGKISIKADASLSDWVLFLRSSFKIDSIWGAKLTEVSSDEGSILYRLESADWNSAIAKGQTTSIGFTAKTGVEGIVKEQILRKGLAVEEDASSDSIGLGVLNVLGATMRAASGADRLIGSQDDDTFYVDDAQDVVTETSSGGAADSVVTSVSYTLGDFLENLTAATGKKSVNLSGNGLKNVIVGNAGANKLAGGLGSDTLTGGQDQDTFVFGAKLSKDNIDKITDFSVKDDSIALDNAIFKKLGSGTASNPKKLAKAFFTVGDKAKDAKDYLIYNSKTGVLSYDPDGSGTAKAVAFATLSKKLKITYADFFVI